MEMYVSDVTRTAATVILGERRATYICTHDSEPLPCNLTPIGIGMQTKGLTNVAKKKAAEAIREKRSNQ